MPVSIQAYVNDESRDVVSLETAPIPDLDYLTLEYGSGEGNGRPPFLFATSEDYVAGAYHLRDTEADDACPGCYRVRGVSVRYKNRTTVLAPVREEIVVKVVALEPPTEPLPVFTAR